MNRTIRVPNFAIRQQTQGGQIFDGAAFMLAALWS